MRRVHFFLFIFLASCLSAHVQAQPLVSKSFLLPLPSKGEIRLRNLFGDIAVHPWNLSSVKIEVDLIRHDDGPILQDGSPLLNEMEKRAELERLISIEKKSEGSRLSMEAKLNPKFAKAAGFLKGGKEKRRFSVNFRLFLPDRVKFNIQNLDGDVTLSGIHADGEVSTYTGTINMENIKGDLHLKIGRGQVEVRNSGGAITLEQEGGELKVSHFSGKLNAQMERGKILYQDITGEIRTQTESAEIKAEKLQGKGVLRSINAPVQCSDCKGEFAVSSQDEPAPVISNQKTP